MKKFISVLLTLSIMLGAFTCAAVNTSAASKKTAKVSLKNKTTVLVISKKDGKTSYGSTKITLKKAKGVKLIKTTFKSSKKAVAKVNKKGKVTALKTGSAKITVKVKYTFKKKSYKKTLSFKVSVISDYKDFLRRLSKFSNKLYNMSAKDINDNYTMSPVSVFMALSMLYSSADDNVKAEIKKLTGMKASDFKYTAKLMKSLNKEYKDNDKVLCKLNLTNSIWYDSGEEVKTDALDKIAKELFGEVIDAPFKSNNAEANKKVRDYIKDKTNGLIDKDFDLSDETLFALINTLYFKDNWDASDLSTKKMNFTSPNGTKKREYLIGRYQEGRVQETKHARYFYSTTMHGYKIKLVLPKKGCTLKQAMSVSELNKINSRKDFKITSKDKSRHYTRCIFPSFKVESDTPLKDVFEENGYLNNAFYAFDSPFTDEKLQVSDIAHSSVLDVNKKGIEGAAVTLIMIEKTSAIMAKKVYHDFTLDRSFGYILTDPNDVVLFTGQITK